MNRKIKDISKTPMGICKNGKKLEGEVGNYLNKEQIQNLEKVIKEKGLGIENIKNLSYDSCIENVWEEYEYEGKFSFSGEYKTSSKHRLWVEDDKGKIHKIKWDNNF